MKDLFICPRCRKTTEFEGVPPPHRIYVREVLCACGRKYLLAVNYGCVVQAFKELPDPTRRVVT